VGVQQGGEISDSYAVGLVTASAKSAGAGTILGGLVAQASSDATITRTYASVFIRAPSAATTAGLVGAGAPGLTVTDSFWDTETSKITAVSPGTGKTADEMTDPATFTAFDLNGATSPWTIRTSAPLSFPLLRFASGFKGPSQSPAPSPGLLATRDDIFIDPNDPAAPPAYPVTDWNELSDIRDFPSENFVLLNDLTDQSDGYTDLVEDSDGLVSGGTGWVPIPSFAGSFDGRGNTITGLKMDLNTQSVGLFALVDSTATVKNVKFESADVRGGTSSMVVGVLGARVRGTVDQITLKDSSLSATDTGTSAGDGRGGLVGILQAGGRLSNIEIIDTDVTVDAVGGGAVGRALENTVMEEVHVSGGTIKATSTSFFANVGGVVGSMGGSAGQLSSLRDSSVSGENKVEASVGSVGGLAGHMEAHSEVLRSFSNNIVTSTGANAFDVGGLIGRMEPNTEVFRSYSTSQVSGDSAVGGLVGVLRESARISQSYTVPNVSGRTNVGGLVGTMFEPDSNERIQDSYAAGGAVTGDETFSNTSDQFVGGLVGGIRVPGFATPRIINSYAATEISGPGKLVGGLVGGIEGSGTAATAQSSYWDTTVSGLDVSAAGAVGKTILEMLDINTFVDWDTDDIWTIDGSNYPYLEGNSPIAAGLPLPAPPVDLLPKCPGDMEGQGNGSSAAPCQISTWDDLAAIGMEPTFSYILTQDLDASIDGYADFEALLSVTFTGRLEGDENTISGLIIDSADQDNVGLFGEIGGGGVVVDLTIADAEVTGKDNVGVLAGLSAGTIDGVEVSGRVNGGEAVGGLVGRHETGSITNSSAEVEVNGISRVGGLVGLLISGELVDSAALGDVTGEQDEVGGAIGSAGELGVGAPKLIKGVSASGAVIGRDRVGGLVGDLRLSSESFAPGLLTQSFATGSVTSNRSAPSNNVSSDTNPATGGLVGYVSDADDGVRISQSFATGDVRAPRSAGGLVDH